MKDFLVAYSEWLDQQKILKYGEETHEELVTKFLMDREMNYPEPLTSGGGVAKVKWETP